MSRLHKTFLLLTVSILIRPALAEDAFSEVRRIKAAEAKQAVATDAEHVYAITNSEIGKYDLKSGTLVQRWTASDEYPLKHLNSGVVRDGQLICAHSNYPQYPEASSIEVWDTATLQHVDSHSFGIYEGSLTWIDWKDDAWWAVFAHYSKPTESGTTAKGTRWTSLVQFDINWHRQAAWVFPEEVLDRFEPHSCSGGAWGPDGALYCTGHDLAEVYQLKLPKAGATLQLTHTFSAPITGQGIAWSHDGKYLFGIDRKKREVVICRLRMALAASKPNEE